MIYGFPDMGRTGLGHSLLAWGRCVVWCHDTGERILARRWLRPRIGPILCCERDKRNYFLLFQKGGALRELWRNVTLLTASRFNAELDLHELGTVVARPTVVVFRNALTANEAKLFYLITREGPFRHRQLIAVTRPHYGLAPKRVPFSAVHVRMGDFGTATTAQLRAEVRNARIPIEWYAGIVQQLQARLGPAATFVGLRMAPTRMLHLFCTCQMSLARLGKPR